MSKELFTKAITRFIAGVVLLGVLLFVPAGTWKYPQGWLFMGILFVPMFAAGLVMMKKNPELLEKRLNVKEKESEQREVIYNQACHNLSEVQYHDVPCRAELRHADDV